MRNKGWLAILLAIILCILLAILLWPIPIHTTKIGEILASWAASLFTGSGQTKSQVLVQLEVWLNFLVFIPFSMAIYFTAARFAAVWALSVSLFLSGGAEICQKYLLVHRVATIQDVYLNFSGAVAGVLFCLLITQVGKRIRTSRGK